MQDVWVIKDDGSLQCHDYPGVPLDEMQKELEMLGAKVLDAEKRQDCRFIIQVCGAPTGQVNAYKISWADWQKILNGIIGPLGFRLWTCDMEAGTTGDGGEIPWPWIAMAAQSSSVRHSPALIRDLIGRPCRCYRQGDALTRDYRPDRVNIELTDKNIIADIWFG